MTPDFFGKNIYFHLFLIAMAGLLAYSNSFTVPFQFDDRGVIAENSFIRDIDNLTPSAKVLANSPRYEYNPRRYIGYVTLALNYRWGGLDVTGYHVVNLLIHLINGILVYFFAALTFRTPYFNVSGTSDQGSGTQIPKFIALFAALLFVAHPVQTQAVTYIVQRFTSLATLFYLLSIVMYVKGRLITQSEPHGVTQPLLLVEHNSPYPPLNLRGGGAAGGVNLFSLFCYVLSLLSAVCAMKTKEIAFTLPIMILLYEFTFFRSSLKKKLLFLLPVLLTLVIIPMSMMHIDKPLGALLSDLSERTRLDTDMARGDYLMTEMRVVVTYIRLLLLPINQNLDYDFPVSRSFFTPPVFFSFLLLAMILGSALYLLYRSRFTLHHSRVPDASPFTIHYSRLIGFGILWFFLALSVESSFIPIVDVLFEHRIYLPSIGAFIALSAALSAAVNEAGKRWPRTEKAVIPLALIVVLSLSAGTFARNRVWQDELGLWEDVVKKSAGSPRAHNNLGFLYNAKGMNDLAIEQFMAALRVRPDYPDAHLNLGIAYNAKGMSDPAIEQFMLVLGLSPDDADAHLNLGLALVSKGMYDEGITHYKTALGLQPDFAEAYNNLGVAYGSRGMFDQARENFEHAIKLKPDYFEAYYNLALVYEKTGDYEKAAALKSKAGEINPAYR
ncbi:MAG: tetratricopeptide repeat protein [Thermodesulfovibrionales bacterium]